MNRIWRHALYVMRENLLTLAAFVLLLGFVVGALWGPWLAPHDPLRSNTVQAFQPPSWQHWFGTDHLGRDILSRVLVATRLDVSLAVSAVALSLLVGSMAGACAGFYGGWVDRLVSRVVDTIMAFPLFVLAMGIVAALGNTVANIILATAIINVPFYARIARSEVNVRRDAGFVEAARLCGNSDLRLLTVEAALAEQRGRELAMIFQHPRTALNPIRPVGKQIGDVLLRHAAIVRAGVKDRALALLAFARFERRAAAL
jgi:peptide/nickel transport system permease protein